MLKNFTDAADADADADNDADDDEEEGRRKVVNQW